MTSNLTDKTFKKTQRKVKNFGSGTYQDAETKVSYQLLKTQFNFTFIKAVFYKWLSKEKILQKLVFEETLLKPLIFFMVSFLCQ